MAGLRTTGARRDAILTARLAAVGATYGSLSSYDGDKWNPGKRYIVWFTVAGEPPMTGRTEHHIGAFNLDDLDALTADPAALAWYCWQACSRDHRDNYQEGRDGVSEEGGREVYHRATRLTDLGRRQERAARAYGDHSARAFIAVVTAAPLDEQAGHGRALAEAAIDLRHAALALKAAEDAVAAIVGPEPPRPATYYRER
jgi:hypothetical protein